MEYYDAVLYHSKHNKDELLKALNIVRKFIKSRNLILYGGISIDYAMRLKGMELYNDTTFPDYDFMTTDPIKDAYDLVEVLWKNGIEAQAIHARHPQTLRVRIDFEVVADISYIRKDIFDNIPTLEYDKLRFVHPEYQIIDMHHSMAFPYADPGSENFINRLKKDNERFEILYELYVKEGHNKICKKMDKMKTDEFIVSNELNAGLGAYALCTIAYKQICDKLKIQPKKITEFAINTKKNIDYVLIPKFNNEMRYSVIVKEFNDKIIQDGTFTDHVAEIKTDVVRTKTYEFHKLISHVCYSYIHIGKNPYKCVGIHYILKQFLVEYWLHKFGYYGKKEEVPMYIQLYEDCITMIFHLDTILDDADDLIELFVATPFSPIIENVFENENCDLRCKITEDDMLLTLDGRKKIYPRVKNFYLNKEKKDLGRPVYTKEELDELKKYIFK
jgi:hypothetical protein